MLSDPDDENRDGPWNVRNFYPTNIADIPRRFYKHRAEFFFKDVTVLH
jgi:hypothetical protein